VEKQLPTLLRDISDMRDIGMTLQGAIKMISNNKTGVLSSEIKIVSDEIHYGSSISSALVRMEERIGLITVKRAISLLVKASEVTDALREILAIAISDLDHYIKMKSKRLNVSFVYLAVIYLSYGIYLYSAYQMNVAFISSFASYNITFDISSSKTTMFHIGIILGFFSGIMAGQLSSNSIYAGLKHSTILLIAAVAVFVYFI
jgi:flagellar protein FlaJ